MVARVSPFPPPPNNNNRERNTDVIRYIDPYSATRPDSNAFFGNLSFVLHLSNKTRIGCANFTVQGVAPPSPPYSIGNSTATLKPTGAAAPTTSPPAQFTGAAAKLVGGTGALIAAAAALVL